MSRKLDYVRGVMISRQQPCINEINKKLNNFVNSDFTRYDIHTNDTDGKDLWTYYNLCKDNDVKYQPILNAVYQNDFETLRTLIDGIGDLPETTKYLADYDILYNSTYFDS